MAARSMDETQVRVVVRRYVDGRFHRYRQNQFEDDRTRVVMPVCQEDRFYPGRHELLDISDQPREYETSRLYYCPGCDVWSRQHREVVIDRGEVFA